MLALTIYVLQYKVVGLLPITSFLMVVEGLWKNSHKKNARQGPMLQFQRFNILRQANIGYYSL